MLPPATASAAPRRSCRYSWLLRRLHFRLGPLQFGLWCARWSGRDGELPYQDVIDEAERFGTVLYRENIYRSGAPVDALSDDILDFVLGNVGDTVLDIGCGAGPYVARINGEGRRCIGIDLAFADNAFDSVVLIERLEHLPNYERALEEAARVARSSVVVRRHPAGRLLRRRRGGPVHARSGGGPAVTPGPPARVPT